MRATAFIAVVGIGVATNGCADLPLGDLNRCGNRILEPDNGEDCDGSAAAFGSDARCNDRCRLVCDAESLCPSGYACGQDGVCRTESGAWAFVDTVAGQGQAPGAIELATIEPPGRAVDELFRVAPRATPGPAGQATGSLACTVQSFAAGTDLDRLPVPCPGLRVLIDLDGDNHDDILTSTFSPATSPDIPTPSRYEVFTAETNWQLSVPEPSIPLGAEPPVLYALDEERRTRQPIVLARVGADVSILDWRTLRSVQSYPGIIEPDLPEDTRIEVLPLRSSYDASAEYDTLAVTVESTGRVQLYDFQQFEGAPGIERRRTIEMPAGVQIRGRAISVEANVIETDGFGVDGIKDLLVTDGDTPHIAFGRVFGDFDSEPPGPDGPVPRVSNSFGVAPEELSTAESLFRPNFPEAPPGTSFPEFGGLLVAGYINEGPALSAVFENALVLQILGGGDPISLAFGFEHTDAAAADLDANGYTDFVMVSQDETSTYGAGLIALRSQGEEIVTDTIIEDFEGTFELADIDGNAIDDILFVRPSLTQAGWHDLAFARGRPLQSPAAPQLLATFPAITNPVFLGRAPQSALDEFMAVVEVDDGSFAALRFAADTDPAPINLWAQARDPDTDESWSIAPVAAAVGHFAANADAPELVLAAASDTAGEDGGRLVHVTTGMVPLVDSAHARSSQPLDAARSELEYAVMTRFGLGDGRDGVLMAVPRDAADAGAGSDIIVGRISSDRRWTTTLTTTTTQLIAKANGSPGAPGPLAPDRAGASAIAIDVDGDGVDEALFVSGTDSDPWFLFGADDASGARLLALVTPPPGRIDDVAAAPMAPGRVFWTGPRGTSTATIVVLPADEAASNPYGVGGAVLSELTVIENAGGLAVTTGNFDTDGLIDVAVADTSSVRIYRSLPTIE